MPQLASDTMRTGKHRWWHSIGPAIIVASVVLGPGSILTSSQIGSQFGYAMVWMLILGAAIMMGFMALGARLGVSLSDTPCNELAKRLGRPFTVVIGVSVFFIIALFQATNNAAVLSVIELLLPAGLEIRTSASVGLLLLLNAIIVTTLLGFKSLYKPIERMMMALVMIMLLAFLWNLFMARPSLTTILGGLVPQLPETLREQVIPRRGDGDSIIDPWLPIQALFATTISVAGAFYQAYLVREKGWGINEVRKGTTDSLVGIAVLGGISLMIMVTAASVLQGQTLASVGDVALQLEPAFGARAVLLFSVGLFAAAFSSFLVNAMVGGTIMSDSVKLGGSINQAGPKLFTIAALLVGAAVAVTTQLTKLELVQFVVAAQALTVLGLPLLAASMVYLAVRSRGQSRHGASRWMIGVACVGTLIVCYLAMRTAIRLGIHWEIDRLWAGGS